MDKFTRNYSLLLAAAGLFLLFYLFYESPDVRRLNTLLKNDSVLASYPYRFRVTGLENGVATMTTPRSAEFPAYRALAILYPALAGEAADSEAMIEAQESLAAVQARAQKTVVDAEGVNRVRWQLDENWLRGSGINPDTL